MRYHYFAKPLLDLSILYEHAQINECIANKQLVISSVISDSTILKVMDFIFSVELFTYID